MTPDDATTAATLVVPVRGDDGHRFTHDTAPMGADFTLSVPGYKILSKLGEGGMGVVYKARDAARGRDVALKLSPAGPPDSREVIRFLAEAEAVAAIAHPHVVRVFEYGEHAGRPFLALEYLPGGSLADRLKAAAGRMTPRDAAALVEVVTRAVHAAHERGIVHRDLKPSNILFDADDKPRVTDFGIAKRQTSDLTATVEVMGTPAYMAPEQATGKAKFVAPSADVWALGAILYELLTGVRPFGGGSINAVLYRVVHNDPVPPRRVVPDVPRDLERVCLHCLEKEPHERYPSAVALAEDLARFGRGEAVSVRPPGVAERALRWARKDPSRAVAYGLTAAVVVLVPLGTGAAVLWRRAEGDRAAAVTANIELAAEKAKTDDARKAAEDAGQDAVVQRNRAEAERDAKETARKAAEDARREADRQRTEAETATADARKAQGEAEAAREGEERLRLQLEAVYEPGNRFVYGKLIDLAYREWQVNNPPQARDYLKDCPPKFRGWEWGYVSRLAQADRIVFAGHHGPLASAAYSPNGTKVVTAGADGTAKIWDARTGAALRSLTDHGPFYAAAFSPDGSRVVTAGSDGKARIWVTATGAELLIIAAHAPGVTAAAFSPDGADLVTVGFDQTARVWDATTGRERCRVGGSGAGFQAVRFSPDGGSIITAGSDGTATVWNAATGAKWAEFKAAPGLTAAAFSPNGDRVLTAGVDATAVVWDAATGRELSRIVGPAGGFLGASFSPDGRSVVTAGGDGAFRVWHAGTGRPTHAVRVQRSGLRSAAFAPDGRHVLTADGDGTARVWDAVPVDERVLVGPDRPSRVHAVGPAANRLLIERADRPPTLWEPATGREVPIALDPGAVRLAAFGPGATRVATADGNGAVVVWDAATGARLASCKGAGVAATALAFADRGDRVAAGRADGSTSVWDARTGAVLHTLTGHKSTVSAVTFTRDGARLLTAGVDGALRVWDAATGAVVSKADGRVVFQSAAFAPDGLVVATGGADGSVRVWDVSTATGKEKLALDAGVPVGGLAVAYHPDGTRLATGGPDGRVRLWDTKGGAEVFARGTAGVGVNVLQFTADGSTLVAGNRSTRVVAWDASPVGKQTGER